MNFANMDLTEEEVLRKNHTYIIDNVQVADVKDHLYQEFVLSVEEFETLRVQGDTERERMRRLMIILQRRASETFPIFLAALQNGGYEYVAKRLKDSYQGRSLEKEDEKRTWQQKLEEMGRRVDTYAEEANTARNERDAAQKRLVDMERLMSAKEAETEKTVTSLHEQIRKIKQERDRLEDVLKKKNDLKAAVHALKNERGSPPEEPLRTYKSIQRNLLTEKRRPDIADLVYTQLVKDHSDFIMGAQQDLLSWKTLIDVNVTVGSKSFPCHKALLVAWSGYFLTLFGSDFDGKGEDSVQLEVSELLSVESFTILHDGLYKGKFGVDRDTVGGVLRAAFYLEMGDVVDICVVYIQARYKEGHTPVNKMMSDLQIANLLGLDDLAETVLQQIASVFEDVCLEEELQQDLSPREFLKLLRNDMLIAENEDIVFAAAFHWLMYDVRRLEYICDILKSVRLGLVSVSTVVQWTSKQEVLAVMSADGECRSLMLAALCMNLLDDSKDELKKKNPMMFVQRTSQKGYYLPETEASMAPEVDMDMLSREALRNAYKNLAVLKPDLEINIYGRMHSCHMAVLCGCSGYLQREIASMVQVVRLSPQSADVDEQPQTGSPRPCVVALKHDDVTSESLSVIHDFIYLGKNRLDFSNICDVMASCRFLQMESLTKYAIKYFSLYLTPRLNTLDHGMLTVMYSESAKLDTKLVHNVLLNTVVKKFKDVSLTDAFLDRVDVDGLLAIIRHPNLQVCSEDVVCRAVFDWLNKNHEQGRITEIVKSIRLGLVEVPTISSGIQLGNICKESEARTILRHAADRESDSQSLGFIKRNYPYMFDSRKNQAYYEGLHMTTAVDWTQDGPGKLTNPYGVCVSKGRLLVTDYLNNRLVACYNHDDCGTYKYLCHLDVEDPCHCVADVITGTTYVTCLDKHHILEVKWYDDFQRLTISRTLTGRGTLSLPGGICFDEGRSHLYVACTNGVKKISLTDEKVVTELSRMERLKERPSNVTAMGNKILVCYTGDKCLLLHDGDGDPGRIITPTGLASPVGVGNDGVNFLVGDVDTESMFVLSPQGDVVARVPTGKVAPEAMTAVDGCVYFTREPKVYVLR